MFQSKCILNLIMSYFKICKILLSHSRLSEVPYVAEEKMKYEIFYLFMSKLEK